MPALLIALYLVASQSLNHDKVFARTGIGKYALAALTGGLDIRIKRKSESHRLVLSQTTCHYSFPKRVTFSCFLVTLVHMLEGIKPL